MSKMGLKLYSTDSETDCKNALELFEKRLFDYIELYVVPDSTDCIEKWKNFQTATRNGMTVKIPFMLHAPDFKHNVNLSNPKELDKNTEIFNQIEMYRQGLNSICTIVNPGYRGSVSEPIRQLKAIMPKNFIIKNNIFRIASQNNTAGVGAMDEEISKLRSEIKCGFCLDIVNAICTANSLSLDPYDYLRSFNSFNPIMYRISGTDINSTVNTHESLERATFDYSIISLIIRNNALITITSDRTENGSFDGFVKDVQFLKRYCK